MLIFKSPLFKFCSTSARGSTFVALDAYTGPQVFTIGFVLGILPLFLEEALYTIGRVKYCEYITGIGTQEDTGRGKGKDR